MPDVVIVDRSTVFGKPDYCIHGETLCVRCQKGCWLGTETIRLVQGGAVPICVECANVMARMGHLPKAPTTRVEDHRRADGPHRD